MKVKEKLIEMNACEEAVVWVGRRGLKKAWAECERADWMLWLCGKMVDKPGWPTRKKLTLIACDCASRALKHVTEGEDRPRKAIETARDWVKGKATIEQVRAAAAAYAAADVYAYAADAAADAADADVYAAAAWGIRKKELAIMANMVRRKIKIPVRLILVRRANES